MKKTTKTSHNQTFLKWKAPDYHPHQKGWFWNLGFCGVMFGSAIFFLIWDQEWGWVSAFTFCFVAAIYFWVHRHDSCDHEIKIQKSHLVVDRHQFAWDNFVGFWVLEDEYSRLLVLEPAKRFSQRVILQLGELTLASLHNALKKTQIQEIESDKQKEAMTDLWIRALKL